LKTLGERPNWHGEFAISRLLGIRSASAAGMRVVAIPNRAFPPSAETLRLAAVVLDSIAELEPEVVEL
jgi:beta-phosphoglucomutase-like phosphatase (HAD superfamily)